jgi:hypothetical protein
MSAPAGLDLTSDRGADPVRGAAPTGFPGPCNANQDKPNMLIRSQP